MEILADGSSLSYLTVDVKDMNGNIVAGADNRINFKIEGMVKLLGLIMVMQLILIVIRELHEKPFQERH